MPAPLAFTAVLDALDAGIRRPAPERLVCDWGGKLVTQSEFDAARADLPALQRGNFGFAVVFGEAA